MEAKNIDDLIVKSMNEQAPVQPHSDPVLEVSNPIKEHAEIPSQPPEQEKTEEVSNEPLSTPEESIDNPIDEYGNPVEKPRSYTEDEVQRMIRDRLSRGRHAEQQQTQPAKQSTDNFQSDPNSEESWENQLESFIEKTIDKRQAKMTQQQWEQQESAKQADFESKFSSGMNKYNDFHNVVAGKPITDSMLLATRNLDNPAAFVYGAAKLHPQELDRISKIQDPYVQAAEVGRLHERMVKTRSTNSQAPKPIESPKGDMPSKHNYQPSLDQRIFEHAKAKRK